jgi:hypothetical protein
LNHFELGPLVNDLSATKKAPTSQLEEERAYPTRHVSTRT